MASTVIVREVPRECLEAPRPSATIAGLLSTDALALGVSVALAVFIKALAGFPVSLTSYLRLWPFLFVFLLVYSAIGLYSIVALNPPEELRRGTLSSVVVFVVLAATTVSFRGARHQFTWTLLLALLLSVVLLPLMRAGARRLFAARSWWGFPAVIFGAGAGAEQVIRAMRDDPAIGLKPVAVIDNRAISHISGVPVLSEFDWRSSGRVRGEASYGVFVAPEYPPDRLAAMLDRYRGSFSHLVVVSDPDAGFGSLWALSKAMGGMLGLQVDSAKGQPQLKRLLDVIFGGSLLLLAVPFGLLCAALIRLDSSGPVFYRHLRLGRNGEPFDAWKFRTMVMGAQEVLERHLALNPAARLEWEATHKLRDDPRVTRVGRILRRTSLDELPQLWNVLKGEMSLVGPRPIVESEVFRYGSKFDIYKRVKGGITGLWQVSGRSDTSYEERVSLDIFYVRNWSVWLDLCILFRTCIVVLFGKGAY